MVLLRQLFYAIKNQLIDALSPLLGAFLASTLRYEDGWLQHVLNAQLWKRVLSSVITDTTIHSTRHNRCSEMHSWFVLIIIMTELISGGFLSEKLF